MAKSDDICPEEKNGLVVADVFRSSRFVRNAGAVSSYSDDNVAELEI